MRYTVEIYTVNDDGTEDILRRTTITAFSPQVVFKEARRLTAALKNRHARGRVLNSHGETIYTVSE